MAWSPLRRLAQRTSSPTSPQLLKKCSEIASSGNTTLTDCQRTPPHTLGPSKSYLIFSNSDLLSFSLWGVYQDSFAYELAGIYNKKVPSLLVASYVANVKSTLKVMKVGGEIPAACGCSGTAAWLKWLACTMQVWEDDFGIQSLHY